MNTEEKTAHTPGPWKYDSNGGCKTIKGGKLGSHQQAQYQEIAFTTGLYNEEQDLANAKLIASAPSLLEENRKLKSEIAELKAENDKLAKFKKYVHDRLDQFGVPADPEPANNKLHGCRIEGRLNWIARKDVIKTR